MRFPVWRELKQLTRRFLQWHGQYFLWDFPFEGNWNSFSDRFIGMLFYWLSMRFPVWRELKRWIHSLIHRSFSLFLWDFPFEGNWNLLVKSIPIRVCMSFLWDFPFEGNWNTTILRWESCRAILTFLWDFPFEGNWNTRAVPTISPPEGFLSMRFPVWRELKPVHSAYSEFHLSNFLWDFPFEGNWNGIGATSDAVVEDSFLWDFPFEGNWNCL